MLAGAGATAAAATAIGHLGGRLCLARAINSVPSHLCILLLVEFAILLRTTATAATSRDHTLILATTHLEVRLLRATSEGRLATRGLETGLLEHTLERLHGRTMAATALQFDRSTTERKNHLFVLTPTEFYALHVTQDGGSTVNCWALAAPLVRR
jgi:hypothetical protein